jgi:hypothetical protein
MFLPPNTPLPPINVVVQNPPGWPVWATTLFSASVGAVFGIAGGIFMEYAKPWIGKRRLAKVILAQLSEELLDNMGIIETANYMLGSQEIKLDAERRIKLAGITLRHMKNDRFDYYFKNEKSLVYVVDKEKQLVQLHYRR